MRRRTSLLLVFVALSLLGLQASGLHVHLNEHGYHGAPTGHHVHSHGRDGHVHEGDTDLSLTKPLTVTAKLLLGMAPIAGIVLSQIALGFAVIAHPRTVLPPDCRTRLRPPLRAPPRAAPSR